MQDSENKKQESIESSEQLTAPSIQPQTPRRVSLQELKATAEMLAGFREGVREGTFKGKNLVHIAQGLMFLDNMVLQSQQDLNKAKTQSENMEKQAKEAIKAAGGKVPEGANGGQANA